ncbi:MAG TPA: hypothetical protein VFV83_07755, partial [Chthoniobacteraceae bacterium]|nr:hypothetical protein [Chthoniobacteraceae bacterium]
MNPDLLSSLQTVEAQQLTRRAFLGRASRGLGALALAGIMNPALVRAAAGPRTKWRGVIHPLDT